MMTTITIMITTCAADCADSVLWDMKEYVPDLILTNKVINLPLRCYIKCLGPP